MDENRDSGIPDPGLLPEEPTAVDEPLAAAGPGAVESRLCPQCAAITDFVDGRCTVCGYAPAEIDHEYYAVAAHAGSPLLARLIVGGLVLALLAVIFIFVVPLFRKGTPSDGSPDPSKIAGAKPGETPAEGEEGFAGHLDAVTVDDALHQRITQALVQANAELKAAGTAAYAYRYNLFEQTVPATSQTIRVTAYLGGQDAQATASKGGDARVRESFAALRDELNSHAGVTASLDLRATEGAESPLSEDRYIVYGYYFGKEHMGQIEPVMEAIETYKSSEGQYPSALGRNVMGNVNSKGGIVYVLNGFGYVPMYETDGNGNIVMGGGSGIGRYTPKAVTGYYLYRFVEEPDKGLDLFSEAEEKYYIDEISPFPYQPDGPVHNMQFHPDGKPDGIGAVVQNGKLLNIGAP
jgi:hypothetical protein